MRGDVSQSDYSESAQQVPSLDCCAARRERVRPPKHGEVAGVELPLDHRPEAADDADVALHVLRKSRELTRMLADVYSNHEITRRDHLLLLQR